jgi:hypothetical protein
MQNNVVLKVFILIKKKLSTYCILENKLEKC